MSQSVGFPNSRSVAWSFALALILTLGVFPALAAPPSAPAVTADPTLPNLFYGATPPNGPNGPVVVFVHGLGGTYADWLEGLNCPTTPPSTPCGKPGPGTGNDMYDYAYQAGFRTVFLSLNTNNTPNNLSIQTNSAMLQTMFPLILAHYGVTKVFFVAHSKGGLDLESAISNPQWLGMANMVMTIGTPNQGDALATWIYLPANQALGETLGLLTPAVQSMEVANVEQLRTQWDPIFQTAVPQIPFYTLSANTYTCVNSTGPCTTAITGPLLAGITEPPGGNLTPCNETGNAPGNSPCNDGLVDHPESLLPESYAMELGVINCNHFELRIGDNSFPFVNAQVLAFQMEQPGIQNVATGGFGDLHNSWSWSMAWFNNNLYVGTGREVYCVTSATAYLEIGLAGLYPPAIGDCTPDYHNLPLRAEIWQYNPATNIWTRVYQSPNTLSTIATNGSIVATAQDIGYRSLTLVTEPGNPPVQALYAGGVTSGELFECHAAPNNTGCTPQGSWPPPRILRTTNGVNWAPIPENGTLSNTSGTSVWTPGPPPNNFLGSLTANGCYGTVNSNCAAVPPGCVPGSLTNPCISYQNYSIRSAGQLPDGTQPNSVLYLQVGDFPGVGRVISSTPGNNPALGDNGGGYGWASPPTGNLPMWILDPFNGFMYAGTGNPPGAGPAVYAIWKTNGNGTGCQTSPSTCWTEIIPDGGFAVGLQADYAMSMEIFSDPTYCPNGCLYAGTDRPNELVRVHPDTTGVVQVDAVDSWDLLVGNPRVVPPGYPSAGIDVVPLSGIGQYFDNGFTGHFWRMGVGGYGGGSIYMGTWDWSADNYVEPAFAPLWSQEFGTDLWRSPDGVNWTFMSKVGLGDGFNTGSRSFSSTPFGLYLGTAREVGGTQVFNVDNTPVDLNNDGVIDQKDVNIMTARLNQPARKNDPMDLDQDGKITANDIQLLRTQCTYPGCEVRAARQATALPSPVVCSAPGTPGGTVNLSWAAVTGAVDYLVYQIGFSASETTVPPGDPVPITAGLDSGLNAQLAAACSGPARRSICTMLPAAQSLVQPGTSTTAFGYPGPPQCLTCCTGTASSTCVNPITATTYTVTPPNTLQALYYVIAQGASGNSSPSNTVGGPSLAQTQCSVPAVGSAKSR